MSAHPWWYVARATGVVAWVLLAGTMLDGLFLTWRRSASPARTLERHRLLGGLAVLFTAAHVGALLLDHFVEYGVADVLVPLQSVYRPGPVGWGIVATYLLVLVEGSSLLRRRLSIRRWRALHHLSYPLFGMATVHFLTTGTDAYRWLPSWLSFTVGALIVGACLAGYGRARRLADETEILGGR